MNLIKTNQLTMSSREIAELTGKKHSHVKRDIEKMCSEINHPNLEGSKYTHNGNVYEEYKLDKDLTLTLVSGYNVKLRHKIIKRLDELESQQVPVLPDFSDPVGVAHAQALSDPMSKIGLARTYQSSAIAQIVIGKTSQKES